MKEINNFLKVFFIVFFCTIVSAKGAILTIGKADAKVTVKVFSSLTCPHCADFHKIIFNNLKKDYIDKGLVKFEHHAFPLDLAALNAEVVIRCQSNDDIKFKFLNEIYNKQKFWAVGSDINKINNSIKKIANEFDLNNEQIDKCLKNEKYQDEILSKRVEAQKKYKIEATPTIFVNEKKYSGKIEYKQFKKKPFRI